MNIVTAMILSIGIKGIAAILEIAIQMLITNYAGVSEYGNYTFYISLVEGAYFVLYSGSIKLNTYYLSTPLYSITEFKRRYVKRFVLPTIIIILLFFIAVKNIYGILAGLILFIYYLAFDQSSVFFARGRQLSALLGEYLFGRIAMLIGVIAIIKLDIISGFMLFMMYGLQFIVMLFWLLARRKELTIGQKEVEVPLRKILEYQFSDIANSFISYSPAILQYIIGGAFSAGFVGIISIVRRFIGFISGPTAKVFLPEFSRLYKERNIEKLQQSYLMIVRIQMVFISLVGILLIGFPYLFLNLFSHDLLPYVNIFTAVALCLVVISCIGPVTGLLQMTGNEHISNRNQWISIFAMIITWLILHNEPFFAVYGLCVQNVVEGLMKYYSVCRWFGHNIIPLNNYILLWLPIVSIRFFVDFLGFQYSFLIFVICTLLILFLNIAFAIQDPMIKQMIVKKMKNLNKKR